MTLEQKQSLFQQNSSSLVQLEQQNYKPKSVYNYQSYRFETLTTQFDEQNESLLVFRTADTNG